MEGERTTHEGLSMVRIDDAVTAEIYPGLTRKLLSYNENLMAVMHVIAAGAVIPLHSHPEDQLSYLISGHIRLSCGDTQLEVHAGDSFVLAGGVEHEAFAAAESVALDVFNGARADYLDWAERTRANPTHPGSPAGPSRRRLS